MRETLELRLQKAAFTLTRAENEKDLLGYVRAHKAIKKAVETIYREGIDIPSVLRVEQIMNDSHANVLGKSNEAHETNEMLAIQAETGFELYRKFVKRTAEYVEWADATRKHVQRGRPMAEGVPYCPVRSGLTEFRDRLIDDLASPRTGSLIPEQEATNRLRLDATVAAERGFLEAFIDNRAQEAELREQQKAQTLRDFDARIKRQTRKAQPEADIPSR